VLYDPSLHEPLTDDAWDGQRVGEQIRALVADAESAFDPQALWPADEWDVYRAEAPVRDLYVGAAGVIWALDSLRREGYADVGIDLSAAALRTLELFRERADYADWYGNDFEPPSTPAASLFMGEAGILVVAWRVGPAEELADALHRRVLENAGNEAVEVMWGSPGTMLAARAMHDWTGEERWRQAWEASAERLFADRDEGGLWLSRLYGSEFRSLTPPHGFAGIAQALRDGGRPLADAGEIVGRAAVVEDGLVNWPPRPGADTLASSDGQVRLQWDSGAPGMIASLAQELEEDLLLGGAELVWRAGPFGDEKGASICHGTAGNGFALLKTFARTDDELWLERARRFAMHALTQAERLPPRYSLFTGGLGAAIFAARCLEVRADYPVLDSWD
jgi:Lanthionine synthetase C-like protein